MCQEPIRNIKIQVFREFSIELEKLWKDFEKISSHYFFQSFEWQKLWYEHQIEHKKPIKNYSIVVLDNNEVIMIIPLNIDYTNRVKKLCWSGFPFSDYNCPLLKKEKKLKKDEFKVIWELIINNSRDFDCIIFHNQPNKIINEENPFFYFLNQNINNKYYGIRLNQNFELKKNEQANINYQTNRISNLGEFKFKIAKNKDEILRIINFIIEHKSKQYDKTNAWNLFKINLYKNFFINSNLKFQKSLYLTYLTLNEKIIAAHSGYTYDKRCYYLFPAYDNDYRKYSPGKILLKKIIDHSRLNSIDYFDLTIGSEDYKKKFSNNEIETSIFFKSINYKGKIFISILKLKELLKKIIR